MATQRPIKTSMWNDPRFSDLDIAEKTLVLYLFTNERTTLSGLYSISIKQISNETGFNKDEVDKLFKRLSDRGIAFYNVENSFAFINKFYEYQNTGDKSIQAGCAREFLSTKEQLLSRVIEITTDSPPTPPRLGLLNLTIPNLTIPNLTIPNDQGSANNKYIINNQELNLSDLSKLDGGSDEEKQKFIDYWNTLIASKGQKRLRRVAEKTFNIKMRRATWVKNLGGAVISDDIKKEMSPLQLSDTDSKTIYDRCLSLGKVSKVLVGRVESGEIAYGAPVMINKYKDGVDIEYIKGIIRKIDDWAGKNGKAIDSYGNLFIKFTDESNRKN